MRSVSECPTCCTKSRLDLHKLMFWLALRKYTILLLKWFIWVRNKGKNGVGPLIFLLFYSQVGHSLTLFILLSCPQISTARSMTSQQSSFVGRLSEKKASTYYCLPIFFCKSNHLNLEAKLFWNEFWSFYFAFFWKKGANFGVNFFLISSFNNSFVSIELH